MLEAIRTFFEEHIAPGGRDDAYRDEEQRVRIAVAALFAEVVRMDDAIAGGERAQVLNSIAERFDLDPEQATALIALAEAEAQTATDLYQFTTQINRAFSPAEKVTLIEHLWRVGYADGSLHQFEDHVIRKIADLIHVPHKDLIATKLRVRGDA
jgi:uncharacterized tellurite resistance protein B-like protein